VYSLKIGVHGVALSLPFGKGTNPEEVINLVTQAEMQCITIPIKSPTWHIDPQSLNDTKIEEMKEKIPSKIQVTGIGYNWPNEFNMITGSTAEWKRNIDYANKLLEIASWFNANHIVIGAPGRSVPAGVSYDEGVRKLVKFFKEVCDDAESYDLMFCIEHSRFSRANIGNTTKGLIDLIDAVDSSRFQMIAQIHDMAINDLDVSDAIRMAGERIKQVHVADVSGLNPLEDGWSSLLLPGMGVLDFDEIFRALKDVGYDSEICLEALLGDDPASALKYYRKNIEEYWIQA